MEKEGTMQPMPTPPWEVWKESPIHFFIRTAFHTVKNDWVRKTNLAGVVLIGFYGLGLAAKNFIAGDSSAGWVNLVFSLPLVAIVPLVIVANRWQRKWDIASQKYLLVVEQWNKEIEARLDYEEHFEAGHTQDCQLLLDRVAEDYSLDADQREDLIDGMNDLIDTHEMSIEEFNEALQAFFLPNDSPGLSDDESAAFRRIVEGFGPEPT